ncbi:MAG: HAD family phosphatase [Clostridia bacterium]|nr:HAD family phosphatase [Clostridia bacterium]
MYKYYLFDFDGTLVDSMPYWSKIMLDILKDYKVDYPDNILDIVCPLGYQKTAEYFVNNLNLNENVDKLVKRMTSEAYYNYINVIPIKDGVENFLRNAKAKGVSLNVLTASPHPMLDPCLKRVGIWDLFDNVWSCEDFSTTKTDPNIYQMVAQKLGSKPSEIAFFDDNINAVKTGKSQGLYTVGLFDEAGRGFTDDMKKTCEKYYNSFLDIKEEI